MKRIVTAREQAEMLTPWREAAVPDWERKRINKNTATDINGDGHDLSWGGNKGYGHGEQSSGLTPTCSCGEGAGSGHSEASGRRWFTDHIKGVERKTSRMHTADAEEDDFWRRHEETKKYFKNMADGLRYVTPEPGTHLAVGPNWKGSVPTGHPDYIPRQSAADDIHGYLKHAPDGHVDFIHTNPNMRQLGIGRKLLDHAGITDTAHAVNMTSDGKAFNDAIRGGGR